MGQKHYSVDEKAKVAYVDFGKIDDSDKAYLLEYLAPIAGYELKPMSAKPRKQAASIHHKKEWYLSQLTEKEQQEFEKLCTTKGKGFLVAKKWFYGKYPDKK